MDRPRRKVQRPLGRRDDGFEARRLDRGAVGVGPRDPLVFASACLVMLAAALAACLLPARRAMRTDPVETLRG